MSMKKYSTVQKERKVFAAVMAVIFLVMIVWLIVECIGLVNPPARKPDAEYPLANAMISWEQSFYPGSWLR